MARIVSTVVTQDKSVAEGKIRPTIETGRIAGRPERAIERIRITDVGSAIRYGIVTVALIKAI